MTPIIIASVRDDHDRVRRCVKTANEVCLPHNSPTA